MGWFLSGLLLVCTNADAQVVYGTVVVAESEVPVADAQVELLRRDGETVVSAMTNQHGIFFLLARSGGEYVVRVTRIGYESVRIEELVVGENEVVEVTLRAAPDAIPLDPIDVIARRPATGVHAFRVRAEERSPFGSFVTREQIEDRPNSRATEFLREIPGVRLAPVTDGMLATQNHIILLRAGTCIPTIYVDGLRVPEHQIDALDDMVTADMLEGVEAYPSAPPAGLESVTHCGSVAFWTRTSDGGRPWDGLRFASALGMFVAGLLLASTIK